MFPTSSDSGGILQGTSQNTQPNSHSRNEPTPHETPQPSKQNNNRELTLNMLFKEIVFCIALALTTYGALHNSPTKVSKHPQASRFFNYDSLVVDWYTGQLATAVAAVNKADVSFMMYYAPWDAECQFVREEFEKAAGVLSDRVYFSAINCWNPGSECRLIHNKIPSWPIMVAYTVTNKGIIYRGPRDAQSMVNFLEKIMRPIKRLASTEDLVNLLSVCEAVAIGFTPLVDKSYYYNIWYNAALKVLEMDTLGEICFASVTSDDLAIDLGVESVPNARLMLWNETKEFNGDINLWNETIISEWLLSNFSQPVGRIIPRWSKAFSFDQFIDGNPILILFTPLNPLYEQIPNYALLREVAMEYYNCKNNESSQWITELVKLQQVQRLLFQQRDIRKFCKDYKFKRPKPPRFHKKPLISKQNKYPWNNTTQKSQKSSFFHFLLKRGLDVTNALDSPDASDRFLSNLGVMECGGNMFPAERHFYDKEQCQTGDLDVEDNSLDELTTSMLPSEDDPLSAENLIQDNIKHYCHVMRFAYSVGPPATPRTLSDVTSVQGLSCQQNFSLHMLAVDSVRNHHFAESLGIDVLNRKDRTAVVILDSKSESQYVLSGDYNTETIRRFIYKFTHKQLRRTLRAPVKGKHTHYFESDKTVDAVDMDNEIIELTAKNYKKIVNTPGTVHVILVCAEDCPWWGSAAVRAAAAALRGAGAAAGALKGAGPAAGALRGAGARAARLHAPRADLPWHLQPHRLPAIVVVTPGRDGGAAESVWVPLSARLSAGSALAAAARALGPPAHLALVTHLCAHYQSNMEKKSCLKEIKEHVTSLIGRNLKYWRRTRDSVLRAALFQRLLPLHNIEFALSLSDTTDLRQDSPKMAALAELLEDLAKHWNIDPSIIRKNVTEPVKTKS